MSEFFFFSRYL